MTKERCRALRKRGYSIGQIAHILKLSESSVHWHVKDVVLTKEQRQRIHDQWRAVMAKVNARRRGRPLRPIPFQTPAWSAELVHLIAHLNFDGRIDRYGCHYYSRARTQALHVKRLLQYLLGVTPKLKLRANGMWLVSCYNVAIAAWLSQKEHELLTVVNSRKSWRKQWLQALFDDEGHIHITKHIRRIRASQHDPNVLRQSRRFLQGFGIKSRIDQHAKAVEITGRDNLMSFKEELNFSPGIRINASRKNGVWNHPFEKRELLDLALGSYKTTTAL